MHRFLTLLMLLLMTALPTQAQEAERTIILAVDWTIGGTVVALALADEVLIYNMREPETPPLRFPFSGARALAFSEDSYKQYQDETVKVFRLAIGSANGITIIDPDTLEVLREIEQPASALRWLNNDLSLFVGGQDSVYIYFASKARDSEEPYALRYSLDLPPAPLENGGDDGIKRIRNIDIFGGALFVRWEFTPRGGEGGTLRVYPLVAQRLRDDETLTPAPDALWETLDAASRTLYADNNNRVLVIQRLPMVSWVESVYWLDLESDQVIQLPIDER